jgi:hypothetical protein
VELHELLGRSAADKRAKTFGNLSPPALEGVTDLPTVAVCNRVEGANMIARCRKCGAEATITPLSRDRWQIQQPKFLAAVCPILRDKLATQGSLSAGESECPHLIEAESSAFDAWSKRKYGS